MTRVIAGRTAVVTGGAQGIGAAIVRALIAEGVRVILADVDVELAEQTAGALAGPAARVQARALDVRDLQAFQDLIAGLEDEGTPPDILINNAGIMPLGPFLEQDPALDDRQLDVNVRGVCNGMRAVLPGMLARRRGHVVNLASTAGVIGIPNAAVYCGTKHAVIGITEAVRREHLGSGVDFTYVLPSIVATELTSGTHALRYPPPVQPTEVAAAVVGALRSGRIEVFVPPFVRMSRLLPAYLPRRAVEALGRLFGVDQVFEGIDAEARRAYQQRIEEP